MIKRKTTVTLDGTAKSDYESICAILEAEAPESQGWYLDHDPLLNRVTATKTDDVTAQ